MSHNQTSTEVQKPGTEQPANATTKEDLQHTLNENPRANENIADNSGNTVPAKGDGEGVGSEVTDGTAG